MDTTRERVTARCRNTHVIEERTMKIRDTVTNLLERNDLRKRHNDVLLACAMELGDSLSMEVVSAHKRLGETPVDSEHEFDAAVIGMDIAERRFLAAHANTEVAL
jgi:hypothetical protein